MPRSEMSAESSGGVRSSATRMALMMVAMHSERASRISSVVDGDGLGHALDQVAALDLHGERLVEREGRADLHLDLLGGALADEQVVLALEVGG
jgi:hypothetical protein